MENTNLKNRLSKSKLYVHKTDANKVVDDIIKQLELLEKSFGLVSNTLNKMVYKKMIKGENPNTISSIAKKCNTQSQAAGKMANNIDSKFRDDKKEYAIQLLNERISVLEKQLEKLS